MKSKKFISLGIFIFMFLVSANASMAQCYVNDQAIPCNIFWAQYGWVFVIGFLIPGLFLLIKPNWILKYQSWSSKKFMGAKYIPSKRTEMIVRLMGAVFTALSLVFLIVLIF